MSKILSRAIGRALCAIGIHDTVFSRYWHGGFRPHFTCSRKGCNYWKE